MKSFILRVYSFFCVILLVGGCGGKQKNTQKELLLEDAREILEQQSNTEIIETKEIPLQDEEFDMPNYKDLLNEEDNT